MVHTVGQEPVATRIFPHHDRKAAVRAEFQGLLDLPVADTSGDSNFAWVRLTGAVLMIDM